MSLLFYLFAYLILTVIIEGIVVFIVHKNSDYVYYSFLGNLLTNPALNYLLVVIVNLCGFAVYWPTIIILEILVVFIEAELYIKMTDLAKSAAFKLALLANFCSFFCGLLLNWLLQLT